jgi:ABC-type multidrug transport system fused ATPase/permease subunit
LSAQGGEHHVSCAISPDEPYTVGQVPDRDLAELQRPVRGRVTLAAVLQALATALSVVPAVAVVEIGRRLLAGQQDGLWPIAWLAVGLFAARLVLYAAAGLISHLADAELAVTLRQLLADHLAVLPLRWFAGGVSAAVKTTVQDDVSALHHAVAHARGDLASAVTGPVVIVGYLMWVDWRLALVTVAATAVAQGVRLRMAQRSAEPVGRIAAANAELSAAAIELVQGISVVKAFGQARAPDRFRAAASGYADAHDEAQRIFIRQRALTRATVAPATTLLLVTGVGIGLVGLGWTQPIDIVAFALLGLGLFEQLTPIYSARDQRRTAVAAAHRVAVLLREPAEPTAEHPRPLPDAVSPNAVSPDAVSPNAVSPDAVLPVQLDGVQFGYTKGHEVLHGIDAVLEPGTVTAVVGPSGAGKSTLGLLLARFYDVTEGAIRLGGVDIRELDRAQLYRHIGFLFQDVVLLRQSVRDNIALADPAATDEVVHAAATAAAIHQRILTLPRGYDSVVGEDALLSGGEAQRVSIARTLLADTPILVLDEATAFADPESEAAVQDALAELAAGRTLLVIAHRLHTVVAADQILVLDEGRVVERGRHDELLRENGLYARLWRAQYGERT